jgi:DtxR family Mn-dependent transcriptional regulator
LEVNRRQQKALCGLNEKDRPLPLSADFDSEAESPDAITHTRREYLAEIYRMHSLAEGEAVTTTALAERLEVSPPAVVRMMRRLAHEGYLRRQPYRGVSLTPEGEREALKSIRRHRLLEVFLVKVMGFGWDEVHDEAHPLQHALTEAFEDRMDAVSGFPTHCPHGDPIPTKDGRIAPVNDRPLLEAPANAPLLLRRVKTDDGAKLRYLAELGLIPGAPLRILHRAPFNGPLRVQNGAQEHVIGTELAEALRVEVAA